MYIYVYQVLFMNRNCELTHITEREIDGSPESINEALRQAKNRAKALDELICKTAILRVKDF